MTKSNSRLRQQCSKLYKIVVGVLSLAPCYVRKKQVRDKGVPSSYHSKWWSVFVEWWLHHCSPLPCKLVKTNQKFYICSDGTHTHMHTLAQKYLIELLLWSASGVHKQSPKVWQEKIGWIGEKTSVDEFFLCPCTKQLFRLTNLAVNQIAKTVQWIENCWHRSSEEGSDAAWCKMENQTTCRYLA